MHQDMGFDISDIAALFKISRQAVYKNIDRVEAMETELQPLSDKSVQYLVVTDIDIDKPYCHWLWTVTPLLKAYIVF